MLDSKSPGSGASSKLKIRATAIGLVGLIAGAIIFYAVSRPDPSSAAATSTTATNTTVPDPTTTTTFPFFAQGDPLEFEVTELDGIPIVILQTESGEFVRVDETYDPAGFVQGHELLISADGSAWERLEEPIDPASRIMGGKVTSAGLILYGRNSSADPTVWISSDGRSWSESVVDPGGGWEITYVGAMPGLVYVGGSPGSWGALEDALTEHLGPGLNQFRLVPQGSNPTDVVVHGPLGIPLASYGLEELGLDPAHFAEPSLPVARASADGLNWHEAAIPGEAGVGDLFEHGAGELWTVTYEGFGPRLFSTTDGTAWTDHGPTISYQFRSWHGDFFTVTDDLQIGTSSDGRDWSTSPITQLLPNPNEWHVAWTATGEGGVALLANWFPFLDRIPTPPTEEEMTVDLEHDDLLVRVSPSSMTVFDTDGSTLLASASLWSATVDPNLTYNPETEEVNFTDPFDGHIVAIFTLDELAALELAAGQVLGRRSVGERTVLLTSPDACTWTTQELMLPDQNINWVAIFGDRLALSVGSRFSPGGPQLWWTNLPDRESGDCL